MLWLTMRQSNRLVTTIFPSRYFNSQNIFLFFELIAHNFEQVKGELFI